MWGNRTLAVWSTRTRGSRSIERMARWIDATTKVSTVGIPADAYTYMSRQRMNLRCVCHHHVQWHPKLQSATSLTTLSRQVVPNLLFLGLIQFVKRLQTPRMLDIEMSCFVVCSAPCGKAQRCHALSVSSCDRGKIRSWLIAGSACALVVKGNPIFQDSWWLVLLDGEGGETKQFLDEIDWRHSKAIALVWYRMMD
jgi:hypothetical protein